MRVPGGLLSVLPLFAILAAAGPLAAQCPSPAPTPAITMEVVGPDSGGWVTMRAHYNFQNLPAGVTKRVGMGISGSPWGNIGYGSITVTNNVGVREVRENFGCWLPSTSTVFGIAEACGKQANDDTQYVVDEEPRPSVALSYDLTPDANGQGKVIVAYEFPFQTEASARKLSIRRVIPGVDGGFSHFQAPQQQGTFSIPWNLSCLGTATLQAKGESCGLTDLDEKTFTLLSKPDVSISASLPDVNGQVTFSIPYVFPNTTASGRRLQLVIDGTTIATATDLAPSGTWTQTYPNACWEKAEVFATACNQTGNPDYTDHEETLEQDREPKIEELTVRRNGMQTGAGKYEVRFGYDVAPGTEPWTARIEVLPYTDIAGNPHPGYDVLPVTTLTDPADTMTIPFSAPETRQLVFRATLTSCTGVDTREVTLNCDPCEQSLAPVYYSDGNMLLSDSDPLPAIAGHSLSRTYHSHEQASGLFGRGWTTLFDRRLTLHTAATGDTVALTTESNETILFRRDGNAFVQTWPVSRAGAGALTYDAASGVYSYRSSGAARIAQFRGSDGRLVAIRNAGTGQQAEIAYDAAGRPTKLTDSWTGLAWTLSIDAQRRVTSIAVANHPSLTWTYAYDANGNLETVTAPGNAAWRTYEYAANRMTASRDALGNLIESHTYSADGAATSSVGAGDEIASIVYGQPATRPDETITVVTHNSGAETSYRLRAVGGAWRTVEITNGCSSCGSREATIVRDPLGRVTRRQNASGYVTETAYAGANVASMQEHLQPANCDPRTDPNRCRMASDALASVALAPSAATITTSYTYGDANWPEKATSISTASVVDPQSIRQETFTYDAASGAVLTATTTGLTGAPAASASRTTQTVLYDGVTTAAFDPGGAFQSAWLSLPQPPRVVQSQDGPRTDVQDVMSYVHYPIDASVPALLRGRLAAVRNAAGHITRIEAYDVFGIATKTVDPNGVVTELATDALGRVSTSTIKGIAGCDTATDPLCATDLTSTRVYAGAGPLQTEQRPGGGVTTYTYDGRGRVRTISRGPSTSDLRERIEYSYDPATGKKSLEVISGFESGAWVETKRESFGYDIDGDLRTVTHGDGAFVAYTYDEDGRIATVRDENHSSANTTYSYDAAGRTAKVTQIAPTPTGFITTSYAYDRHGNLTSVTDPNGNVTTYTYDDFGQMLSQVSPVTGTTTYQYDAAGNNILTSTANGTSTTRTYDVLNRPLTSVSAPPTETVTWTYDSATAGWFGIGRMASMASSAGSTTYRYDRRGLLIQEAAALNGQLGGPVTFTTRFRHDSDGNRSTIFYPSTALTVSYTHDHAGRPTGIPGILLEAEYLPFGPLSRLRFANGTTQTFEHDVRYRVQWNTLTAEATGTPIARYEYGYDAAGNITSIEDDLDPSYDRSFAYDDLNRLTRADTGTSLWRTGEYKWDGMGNILSLALAEVEKGPDDGLLRTAPRPRTEENRPLGRTSTFTYTGNTPLVAEVTTNDLTRTVTHDAAGNELSHAVTRTYSSRNLLEQVTDESEPGSSPHWLSYGYDGRGVRVRQQEGPDPASLPTRFYTYSPELQLLAVTRPSSDSIWAPLPIRPPTPMNMDYEIVWFGSRPVAQVTTGGPTLYTVADHLGTPFLQTDSSATVVWHAEYEPFGNVYLMRSGNRMDQPLRFPGQEVAMNWEGQEENYNVFRWYKTAWGRYTTSDPIGLRGDINLFRYAMSNPAGAKDPLGLKCCVERLVSRLQQIRRVESDGTFTNRIKATICADVLNSEDCVVKQRVLFVGSRESGNPYEVRYSEPFNDVLAPWQIIRSPGRICMNDSPGFNNNSPSQYPLGWVGEFETTVQDVSDVTDKKVVRWSVMTDCLTPQRCLFYGQFP